MLQNGRGKVGADNGPGPEGGEGIKRQNKNRDVDTLTAFHQLGQ